MFGHDACHGVERRDDGSEVEQTVEHRHIISALHSAQHPSVGNVAARVTYKPVHSPVAYYGGTSERCAEHQSFECPATAESHVGLPVSERHGGVYHGMVERKSLTLVYGYRPSRLHGELTEHPVHHLAYLLRVVVKLVASVLPCFRLHLYLRAAVLRSDGEAPAAYRADSAYHSVIVAFLWRRVVFDKHHLRLLLQRKPFVSWIHIVGEHSFYFGVIGVSLPRQGFEPRVVHPLRLGVVCCQAYASLHAVCIESGYITAVQSVEHALVGCIVAHAVEQSHKLRVSLPVHLVQFHHRIFRTCQSVAAEEIRRGIILLQDGPLLVLHHGCKLPEVAYHQQLHTSEGTLVATAEAQHVVHGVEHIRPHHAYLVYHKKVDGAYHTFLLLAHAHLRALRAELGSGHVRGERQLEERVHRHSASIEGGYACGRHDDGTLRCMLLQIAQEGGLARPCPTGEKKTRTGGLYYVPRQLCFLVHDVLCFLRQAQSYAK